MHFLPVYHVCRSTGTSFYRFMDMGSARVAK
jgi:hypothetical protein